MWRLTVDGEKKTVQSPGATTRSVSAIWLACGVDFELLGVFFRATLVAKRVAAFVVVVNAQLLAFAVMYIGSPLLSAISSAATCDSFHRAHLSSVWSRRKSIKNMRQLTAD